MSESESLSGGVRPPEGKAEIIETNYRVGAQNVKTRLGRWGMDFHNPVFIVSAVAVVLFVAYALVFQDQASSFFGWLRPALTSTFDAFFLWSANIFVLFCSVWRWWLALGVACALADPRRSRILAMSLGLPCCLPRAWALV